MMAPRWCPIQAFIGLEWGVCRSKDIASSYAFISSAGSSGDVASYVSTKVSNMRKKAWFALRVAAAGLFCAGVAALVSLSFQDHEIEFRAKLPFLLLIPVVLVARKVGEAAAILGTIAAALVFAMLLFQPLNNVAVANKPARASLAWFLLGGMVCAHLLSPPSARTRRTSDFARRDSDFE